MSKFVLVHGLGCGGWCWSDVRRRLRSMGHEVFSPTLTGVGERCHLLTRNIDLTTHISDIVNVLRFEDLSEVILVGHSYGGMVVTGAADLARDRIARLVYLDAFVPKHGQSVMDLQPPERVVYYHKVAAEKGDGWKVPPQPASFWKLTDLKDLELTDRLSVDHPLATLEQKLELSDGMGYPGPRAFIWASGFNPSPFVKFAEAYRHDPSWMYREIDSGHMMMISHPEQTTALLADISQSH